MPAGDAVAGDYSITVNANAQAGGSDSLEMRYTIRASRIWGLIGLVIYYFYSRSRSHLGRGIVEVHEPEYADLEPDIPGV